MTYTRLDIPLPGRYAGLDYAQNNQELIEAEVATVYQTYADWQRADTVPLIDERRHLGSGRHADVYASGDYAVRVPRRKSSTALTYVEHLVRGRNVPCLEHLVAANDTQTYSYLEQGVTRDSVRANVVGKLAIDCMDEVLDTFIILQSRGLSIDIIGQNTLVSDRGFRFVDYEISSQRMDMKVVHLTQTIGEAGLDYIRDSEGDKAAATDFDERRGALDALYKALTVRSHEAPTFWAQSVARFHDYADGMAEHWTKRTVLY